MAASETLSEEALSNAGISSEQRTDRFDLGFSDVEALARREDRESGWGNATHE
jgi:hypothetical protein